MMEAPGHGAMFQAQNALAERASPEKKVYSREEARKAAREFEAFFLTQTFQQMFKGIRTDGMFGGGHAEKIYRSMLMKEYGNVVAEKGGVGIADKVMDSLLQAQESGQ